MSRLDPEQGHDRKGALQGSESLGSICPEIYKVLVSELKLKLQFQFASDCLDARSEPLPLSGRQSHIYNVGMVNPNTPPASHVTVESCAHGRHGPRQKNQSLSDGTVAKHVQAACRGP